LCSRTMSSNVDLFFPTILRNLTKAPVPREPFCRCTCGVLDPAPQSAGTGGDNNWTLSDPRRLLRSLLESL
jgi:hypothetical protein